MVLPISTVSAPWPSVRPTNATKVSVYATEGITLGLKAVAASQLFVALQFNGDDFGGRMRLVHGLVRQHRLAHVVANGNDVRHVGAYLDVNVDKATVSGGNARSVCDIDSPKGTPQLLFCPSGMLFFCNICTPIATASSLPSPANRMPLQHWLQAPVGYAHALVRL